MSQHSTPYAVPAVGMRKCMICPVCGYAFLATAQHQWIAYIPRMRAEKPVCSYHCMREMERKMGRWQSIRFIDPEEEENSEKTELQSTEQMSLSELRRKKRELEAQLSPIMAEVNELYDTRRMSKIDDYKRGYLFTREKELMEQLGQINRKIREEQQHGRQRNLEGRIPETGRRAGQSGGSCAGAH
ncbi:MAG: hypothetical protein SPG80_13465 [Candidatus Ventricola sp.]|nr:hypothetical protein [Clostridiales bacterium]MDY5350525.1 hypothetical protein [Candidatus Ventricola sp.]